MKRLLLQLNKQDLVHNAVYCRVNNLPCQFPQPESHVAFWIAGWSFADMETSRYVFHCSSDDGKCRCGCFFACVTNCIFKALLNSNSTAQHKISKQCRTATAPHTTLYSPNLKPQTLKRRRSSEQVGEVLVSQQRANRLCQVPSSFGLHWVGLGL